MRDIDLEVTIVWFGFALFVLGFWLWAGSFAIPFAVQAMHDATQFIETAGTLNGCRMLNLMPGECAAWAQEGGW